MEKKIFKVAPLPFQGQKRRFVPQFETALQELSKHNPITTIVDLFGGSGLLSHIAKRRLPECRVIYNDYDNFIFRLDNIPRTNSLLAEIRDILTGIPSGVRLDETTEQHIKNIVRKADQRGYVDFITLSGSLMFIAKYVTNFKEFAKQSLWNRVKQADYDASGYLDGIEIMHCDYMDLFEKYMGRTDVLFLIDPPYLSTDCSTYASDKSWKLKNYLDVLQTLIYGNYIYFTSDKSQIIELCDWFAKNYGLTTPFSNAIVKTYQIKGKIINYTDMMLYKSYEPKNDSLGGGK